MNIDTERLLNRTVTVINRLDAEHHDLEYDAYKATVYSPAMWSERVQRSVTSDGQAVTAKSYTVQIPVDTVHAENGTQAIAGIGDFVVLGHVVVPAGSSRTDVLKQLSGLPAFEVQTVRDLSTNGAVENGTGVLKYLNVIHLEGTGIGRG